MGVRKASPTSADSDRSARERAGGCIPTGTIHSARNAGKSNEASSQRTSPRKGSRSSRWSRERPACFVVTHILLGFFKGDIEREVLK